MRTFQEIKDNYRFSELEMETLKSLFPLMELHADRIVSDFYNLFLQIPDTAKFLQDEAKNGQTASPTPGMAPGHASRAL